MAHAVAQFTNLSSSSSVKLVNNGQFNGSYKSTRASSSTMLRRVSSFSGLCGSNSLDWMLGKTLHSKVAIPTLVKQRRGEGVLKNLGDIRKQVIRMAAEGGSLNNKIPTLEEYGTKLADDTKVADEVWDDFELGKIESTLSIGTSGMDGSKSFGVEKQSPPLSKPFRICRIRIRPQTMPLSREERDFLMLYEEMRQRNPQKTRTLCQFDFWILKEVEKVVKQVLSDHFKIAAEDMGKFTHGPGNILDKILFGEPDFVMFFEEMQRKNPTFSMSSPEFHREVEKVIKPVLNAHFKKQGIEFDATKVGEGLSAV